MERLQKNYPKGTRVELVYMDDDFTDLEFGDQGTVEFVDDIGTVFISWDKGSSLGAAYGRDVIKSCKLP